MFQQLCHAVAYWEKHLIGKSTPPLDIKNISGGSSDGEGLLSDNDNLYGRYLSPSSNLFASSPIRRMTIPSIHVLECEAHRVVTLDPVRTLHTDLDDISQPDNGVNADAEISASDTDSDGSVKEEEVNICETPYVTNENEFLGTVIIIFF